MWRQYLPSHRVVRLHSQGNQRLRRGMWTRPLPSTGYSSDNDNKTLRGNNENPLGSCPCRIGNELCFASFRPTKKHGGSQNRTANSYMAAKYDEAINKQDAAAVAAL